MNRHPMDFVLGLVIAFGVVVGAVWFLVSKTTGFSLPSLSISYIGIAVLAGLVILFWRFPANQLDEFLQTTLGRFLQVAGYVVWFCYAVYALHEGGYLWKYMDLSPRGQLFMSLFVITLAHGVLSAGIYYVFPTDRRVFRSMTVSALIAGALMLTIAVLNQPKQFFDPYTGKAAVKTDSTGAIYHEEKKKFSPATGEKLEVMTTEKAKKIKTWPERFSSWVGYQWKRLFDPTEKTLRVRDPTYPFILRDELDRQRKFTRVEITVSPGRQTPWLWLPSCGGKPLRYDVWPLTKGGTIYWQQEGGKTHGLIKVKPDGILSNIVGQELKVEADRSDLTYAAWCG